MASSLTWDTPCRITAARSPGSAPRRITAALSRRSRWLTTSAGTPATSVAMMLSAICWGREPAAPPPPLVRREGVIQCQRRALPSSRIATPYEAERAARVQRGDQNRDPQMPRADRPADLLQHRSQSHLREAPFDVIEPEQPVPQGLNVLRGAHRIGIEQAVETDLIGKK